MVTFNGDLFAQTLSRFGGTTRHAIRPLYSVPAIVSALNVLLCIQNHRCRTSSFLSGRIDSPFLLPSGGRCLIENATQGDGTSEGENEETDQADYAPRSDGRNQPALSSGGSKREEVDSG